MSAQGSVRYLLEHDGVIVETRQPAPRIRRDPHRSSILQVLVQVDTRWIIDAWQRGEHVDVRREVLRLFGLQIETMVDGLLEQGRQKVPGHP